MLFGVEMFDLQSGKRRLSLSESAVLATISGPLPNQSSCGGVDHDSESAMSLRTFAGRIATNLLACTYPSYSARSSGVS